MTNDLLTDPFATPAEPTPEILKNGSYWLPPISDPTAKRQRLTRVTTLVKTVSDMFLIDRYHQREIMIGLAQREDLYDRVCGTDWSDKNALNKLAEQVMEAAKSGRGYAGSEVGTAFHSGTERLDRSDPHGMRKKWDAKFRAYEACMAAHGFTFNPQWIERRVVIEKYGAAGTLDRIGTLHGVHYIDDLKSQKTFYTWWEIAMQLALYANADAMWDESSHRYIQMPKVNRDRAFVTWMPIQHPGDDPDAVDLYEVDIAKGWRAVDLVDLVRKLRKEGEKWGSLVPLTAPLTDEERFAGRIADAGSVADLTKIMQEMTKTWSTTTIPAHLLQQGTARYHELSPQNVR